MVSWRLDPLSATSSHSKANYQGRNLFFLILAICLPAALLYLRLVFGIAATDSRIESHQATWLSRWSFVALFCFFITQLVCARYVQRLLAQGQTRVRDALQYGGVLVMCILFSLTGAVMLEAFGLNVFLRTAGIR